jgi:hypothetical protein
MRQFQKVCEKPQFGEHFQGGRMHGVATEIPEEIVVLFEDSDLNTAASQEITEHHAGRPTTDDTAGRLYNLRRHARSPLNSSLPYSHEACRPITAPECEDVLWRAPRWVGLSLTTMRVISLAVSLATPAAAQWLNLSTPGNPPRAGWQAGPRRTYSQNFRRQTRLLRRVGAARRATLRPQRARRAMRRTSPDTAIE